MRLTLYKKDVLAMIPALMAELEQMVDRINIWSDAEHDPQTGAHTDISVTGLTWNGETQTTVGGAGAAGALPANPTGYLNITIDGSSYVVPFYEAS